MERRFLTLRGANKVDGENAPTRKTDKQMDG